MVLLFCKTFFKRDEESINEEKVIRSKDVK